MTFQTRSVPGLCSRGDEAPNGESDLRLAVHHFDDPDSGVDHVVVPPTQQHTVIHVGGPVVTVRYHVVGFQRGERHTAPWDTARVTVSNSDGPPLRTREQSPFRAQLHDPAASGSHELHPAIAGDLLQKRRGHCPVDS